MPVYRRRQTVQPIASINLTSLLDVTFVLLLAFMIVAPALKSGLKIQLPQIKEPPPITTQKSFTISLKEQKDPSLPVRIYFQGDVVDLDTLKEELTKRYEQYGSEVDIVIEAGRTVPCEDLLKVFAITQKVGIDNIGILVEPVRE